MNSITEVSEIDVVEEIQPESLKLEIISSESGFDAIAEEWNSLVDVADVHIFQTFEWQRIWWKIFGGNNRLHILLFRDQERLVGIMPTFLDYYRLLDLPIYRCLRFIGSRIIKPEKGSVPVDLAFSDYLSVIAHPDYEREVNRTLENYLKTNRSLYNEIILEEVPENSSLLSFVLAEMEESPEWQCTIKEASVCPQIEFPESWDELLSDLSSNARYQIRRDIRRVSEDKIFELQTAQSREEVQQAFENLVEFHQRRWHNLGQPGIFADKRILKFFREITMKFHEKGWLSFRSLTAEGNCVAVDLLFKFKGTLYMIQRGFDDSSEFNQYGPGNVLLYCVIKEAIQGDFNRYDFLRGEESYKLRTANRTPQNREIMIQKQSGSGKSDSGINRYVRGYARLKRKLQNEKHVLGVHLDKGNTLPGLGSYFKKLYRRGIHKFKKSNNEKSQ